MISDLRFTRSAKFERLPAVLWCLLVGLGASSIGCKQGAGDRCEITSDCDTGLTCPPGGGICQALNNVASTGGKTGSTGGAGGASTGGGAGSMGGAGGGDAAGAGGDAGASAPSGQGGGGGAAGIGAAGGGGGAGEGGVGGSSSDASVLDAPPAPAVDAAPEG